MNSKYNEDNVYFVNAEILTPSVMWLLAAIGELMEGILHTPLLGHAWLQHSWFTPVRTSILLKVVIHVVKTW